MDNVNIYIKRLILQRLFILVMNIWPENKSVGYSVMKLYWKTLLLNVGVGQTLKAEYRIHLN